MNINFVLVAEGSSDYHLISHLRELCIYCGATEVTGVALEFERLSNVRKSVLEKVEVARKAEPNANLFFIHRDADSRDASPRYEEIEAAVNACHLETAWVAIVPVQEKEAWLLLDELEIRRVAGKSKGTVQLSLPKARTVENISNPKEYLQEILAQASEASGKKLEKVKQRFPLHRQLLMNRLPIEGEISSVPSWIRMRDDLKKIIQTVEI